MPAYSTLASADDRTFDVSSPVTSKLRLLAYVHLRNIHNSTGAGRVARQITEHLALRDDVKLQVLADREDAARILPQVGSPWSEFDFSYFRTDTSKQQARWFFLNRPHAQEFYPDAQVVFCTGESYVPKGKARLAVTVHDAAYFETSAHRHDRAFRTQQLKWRLLYRKLQREADLFHVVSEFSAERLSHFFPSIRSRLKVVHNAVTPHFFEPVTPDGEQYLRGAGLANKPFLLVPGGLHFRKNADLILRAWPTLSERHPDLTLVVVNHSDPGYTARLLEQSTKVQMAGFVTDDALKSLYMAALAVWFPSRYEGFGLPVIEAMACGAPVVTSRASSLPEIGGDAAVYVDPDKWQDHVDTVDALLNDSQMRARLSLAGRKRAVNFTWHRAVAKLKGYFDNLV